MSAPVPTKATPAAAGTGATAPATNEPSATALVQAARLAMQHDRPIKLDFYADTVSGKAFIGEDGETKEKVLVKAKDEFTSTIGKLYKVGDEKVGIDYILMTENSLYIVSGKVTKRKINLAALQAEADKLEYESL
jgi:hypothetical protein